MAISALVFRWSLIHGYSMDHAGIWLKNRPHRHSLTHIAIKNRKYFDAADSKSMIVFDSAEFRLILLYFIFVMSLIVFSKIQVSF